MANKAVFGIASSEPQAARIATALEAEGFSPNDISVLFPDRGGARDFAHEKNTKAPEGAAAGAATGGLLGAGLGWLVGIGSLAIPGLGPFIAAGPIMAALGGAALGATAGGMTGALVGMGLPELEARQYESKLREGNILISVHTEDAKQRARAKDVFEVAGADDITSTSEASVPKPSESKADRAKTKAEH